MDALQVSSLCETPGLVPDLTHRLSAAISALGIAVRVETKDLLELDPDGYLSKGCGIAFANIHQTPVAEILTHYDTSRHPIFSTLLESGPFGLAREAEEYGYVLKTDYADKCYLCQEAREYLRGKYPDYLVPEQHYQKV